MVRPPSPRLMKFEVAERVGFEPTVPFPTHQISSLAPSTTRTPLRGPESDPSGRGLYQGNLRIHSPPKVESVDRVIGAICRARGVPAPWAAPRTACPPRMPGAAMLAFKGCQGSSLPATDSFCSPWRGPSARGRCRGSARRWWWRTRGTWWWTWSIGAGGQAIPNIASSGR